MGVISNSLELPDGYQTFDWDFSIGGASLNSNTLPDILSSSENSGSELYLYTQHQIFHHDGILKQTRSSPNWEGGVVTFSTCKHFFRTSSKNWEGVWIAGLCPSHCADNCLLFVGQVGRAFKSNYDLSKYVISHYPRIYKYKMANYNPRGDLYTPMQNRNPLTGVQVYDHRNFMEPLNHTRSVEYYKKSPGSVSIRKDGKIPKWWRDLEYVQGASGASADGSKGDGGNGGNGGNGGRRPPSFVLQPCHLYSRPAYWTSYRPRRAVLRLTCGAFADSLRQ